MKANKVESLIHEYLDSPELGELDEDVVQALVKAVRAYYKGLVPEEIKGVGFQNGGWYCYDCNKFFTHDGGEPYTVKHDDHSMTSIPGYNQCRSDIIKAIDES